MHDAAVFVCTHADVTGTRLLGFGYFFPKLSRCCHTPAVLVHACSPPVQKDPHVVRVLAERFLLSWCLYRALFRRLISTAAPCSHSECGRSFCRVCECIMTLAKFRKLVGWTGQSWTYRQFFFFLCTPRTACVSCELTSVSCGSPALVLVRKDACRWIFCLCQSQKPRVFVETRRRFFAGICKIFFRVGMHAGRTWERKENPHEGTQKHSAGWVEG